MSKTNKTCANCGNLWWCKETWRRFYSIDTDMSDCKSWEPDHKYKER